MPNDKIKLWARNTLSAIAGAALMFGAQQVLDVVTVRQTVAEHTRTFAEAKQELKELSTTRTQQTEQIRQLAAAIETMRVRLEDEAKANTTLRLEVLRMLYEHRADNKTTGKD